MTLEEALGRQGQFIIFTDDKPGLAERVKALIPEHVSSQVIPGVAFSGYGNHIHDPPYTLRILLQVLFDNDRGELTAEQRGELRNAVGTVCEALPGRYSVYSGSSQQLYCHRTTMGPACKIA